MEDLETVPGGGGAVLARGGGVQNGLNHGLGGVEVLGRDPDGRLDKLESCGIGGHALGKCQRALACDREARGLTRLADLRRGRGGGVVRSGLMGWGVVAGGGGEGEEEDEGKNG